MTAVTTAAYPLLPVTAAGFTAAVLLTAVRAWLLTHTQRTRTELAEMDLLRLIDTTWNR